MNDSKMGSNECIELTERQRKRLNRIKAECLNDYMPDPTDQQILSGLLDTWDAAEEGFYTEETQEWSLFYRFASRIRRALHTGDDQ